MQPVFVGLVSSEKHDNVNFVFQSFKESHESWRNVKVYFTDKDFSELQILNDEFPTATSLLCVFHVLRFKACIYCHDPLEFEEHWAVLVGGAPKEFVAYLKSFQTCPKGSGENSADACSSAQPPLLITAENAKQCRERLETLPKTPLARSSKRTVATAAIYSK